MQFRSSVPRARRKRSVVFLTHHLPYPPHSGGRRREYELLRRLSRFWSVHVLAVSKTYGEDVEAAPQMLRWCSTVEVVAADERHASPGVSSIERRHASAAAGPALRRILDTVRPQLLHVEGFYLMQHVPQDCPVPVVLEEQNVEYRLLEQRAALEFGSAPTLPTVRDAALTRLRERAAWARADRCVFLTREDEAHARDVAQGLPTWRVPGGCDHLSAGPTGAQSAEADLPDGERDIVFIANFAYRPNRDAAQWAVREIMPRIWEQAPQTRLWLVGNEPDPSFQSDERVVVTGRVDSVNRYLHSSALVLCPLRMGGGVKVKVLEALAAGRPLVTTPVGAQGLSGLDGSAMVCAEAAGCAAAAIELLGSSARRAQLSAAATAYAGRLPTWDAAANELMNCYDEVLRQQPARLVREAEVLR